MNDNYMKLEEVNRMIFLALENSFGPIGTARVSMFPLNDIYARPPFLSFRFKNVDKTDPIYNELKKIISNFQGKLKWDLITNDKIPSYIIIPIIFEKYILNIDFYNREFLENEFSKTGYKNMIDNAVEDIPLLANNINNGGSVSK